MDKKIKILIVDDEPYSRDELKHLLKSYSFLDVIDEAESGESGILKALQYQPDVVFLDVEMPKMNGMQAAKSLTELKKPPIIVFATAYPQFAAEAFRYEAMDYLLKPYDEDQLVQTIERIVKKLSNPAGSTVKKVEGKLAIEEKGEILYIEPKDIIYVYKDEKISKIKSTHRSYETKTSLKDLENRLLTFSFCRIHKSYLVNLNYINRLTPWFNGAFQLELDGCEEKLSVSRNYIKDLRSRIEI